MMSQFQAQTLELNAEAENTDVQRNIDDRPSASSTAEPSVSLGDHERQASQPESDESKTINRMLHGLGLGGRMADMAVVAEEISKEAKSKRKAGRKAKAKVAEPVQSHETSGRTEHLQGEEVGESLPATSSEVPESRSMSAGSVKATDLPEYPQSDPTPESTQPLEATPTLEAAPVTPQYSHQDSTSSPNAGLELPSSTPHRSVTRFGIDDSGSWTFKVMGFSSHAGPKRAWVEIDMVLMKRSASRQHTMPSRHER